MPSIRVYAIADVVEEIDVAVQFDLLEALRREVAKTLEIKIEHVEALWLPLEIGINTAPLMIDVMYSVNPDFSPDKGTRTILADKLAWIALKFDGMPKSVFEVACWILPQHDATFRVAKAE